VLSGKFVSAMRSVASEMTMEQMHEKRGEYSRASRPLPRSPGQNGLELESVAITDLDQTDLEFFNPSNRFDAEGLTQLMEDIEASANCARHRTGFDDQNPHRNLEAERRRRDRTPERTARLDQERHRGPPRLATD